MSSLSFLTEDDIRGSSLDGGDANRLKNSELRFWLKCRSDSCKGFSTKAQLCKRQVLRQVKNPLFTCAEMDRHIVNSGKKHQNS